MKCVPAASVLLLLATVGLARGGDWTQFRGPAGSGSSDDKGLPAEWSIEFSNLLSVLTQLIDLEPAQQSLLEDILDGEVLTADELATMGVRWPAQTGDKDRQPRKAARGGLLDES